MVRRLTAGGGSQERTRLCKPNSLFFRENTGNFIVYVPRAKIPGRKVYPNQSFTSKFPTNRNRELIWTYQGIKSRHQGKSPLHQGKGAPPPDLRFAPLMDMDFATRCPLVRRLRERQSELFSRGQKGNSTVEHRLKRAGRAAGVCQSWFSPPPSVTSAVGKRPARVDFDNIPEVLSWSDAVSIEGSAPVRTCPGNG